MSALALHRFWDRLALVGAMGLLVAIVVTGLDIVGRLSGIPIIRGAIDMVRGCMVLSGAFAVAMAMWRDANVRVEILSAVASPSACAWLDKAWRLVAAILVGLIAWRCLVEALHSLRDGETMPGIAVSVGVLGIIVCIGFGIGAVAGLLSVRSDVDGSKSRDDR